MSELLKQLHLELTDLLGLNAKEPVPPKKGRPVKEEEDEDDEPVKKKSKDDDDGFEERHKSAAKQHKEEAEDDDEPAPTTKKGKIILAHVKAKLKEVLDSKGRDIAVGILEEYDAEKVGDVDEDQFKAFIASCDTALTKKTKKKKEEEDDDDL